MGLGRHSAVSERGVTRAEIRTVLMVNTCISGSTTCGRVAMPMSLWWGLWILEGRLLCFARGIRRCFKLIVPRTQRAILFLVLGNRVTVYVSSVILLFTRSTYLLCFRSATVQIPMIAESATFWSWSRSKLGSLNFVHSADARHYAGRVGLRYV
jgi:hypothetical protein